MQAKGASLRCARHCIFEFLCTTASYTIKSEDAHELTDSALDGMRKPTAPVCGVHDIAFSGLFAQLQRIPSKTLRPMSYQAAQLDGMRNPTSPVCGVHSRVLPGTWPQVRRIPSNPRSCGVPGRLPEFVSESTWGGNICLFSCAAASAAQRQRIPYFLHRRVSSKVIVYQVVLRRPRFNLSLYPTICIGHRRLSLEVVTSSVVLHSLRPTPWMPAS